MRKHNLDEKGLSMTQAVTVSNLANQSATEIMRSLEKVNNYRAIIKYEGNDLTQQEGYKMPTDVVNKLLKVGSYRSLQAFLMENMKLKDKMLKEAQTKKFVSELAQPIYPTLAGFTPKPLMDEEWGWEQLTAAELAEYQESEAIASSIGRFFHKGGHLDELRKELPTINLLPWFLPPGENGKAIPVDIKVHHTDEELFKYHNDMAIEHRKHEQRVNYFKAKVKNLVTEENARIAKQNGVDSAKIASENESLLVDFDRVAKKYNNDIEKERQEFEGNRHDDILRISKLRIVIDSRFQDVIDELLPKAEKEE